MLRLDRSVAREGTKMTSNENQAAQPAEDEHQNLAEHEHDLEQIRAALRGLRYGTVSIIIQDGVVVQIDRTEKKRLRRTSSPLANS